MYINNTSVVDGITSSGVFHYTTVSPLPVCHRSIHSGGDGSRSSSETMNLADQLDKLNSVSVWV